MGFLSLTIKQLEDASMAAPLEPKQIASFEELLMPQAVQQGVLTRF
jgi:hypothetical protein